MKTAQTVITARYQETDRMGIIHHSVYPVWFEAARTELIRVSGFRYSDLENIGLLLPLIKLSVDYRMPSYYEDNILIKSRVSELTPTRMTISYSIYRNNELLKSVCDGSTFHVFSDASLKPLNARKKYPEVFEAFKKLYDE